MTAKEKEKYIKKAFACYRSNKKRLMETTFDGLRGTDFERVRTANGAPKGQENALVVFLDDKQNLEKQIELVERVLEYFKIDGSGKDDYIKARYFDGRFVYQIAMDLYTSDRTLLRWEKEIRRTAERIAEIYNLY